MKKLIYSALAASAAFAVAFGGSAVNVSADETPTPAAQSVLAGSGVSYDISGDSLVISGSNAGKILVGTAKEKNGAFTTSAWDVYENDGAVKVDLSKINKAKDAYLQVKADFETDAQAYTLKLPASDTIKGSYDKATGEVKVVDSTKAAYTGIVNFRTESQFDVQPLSELNVYTYQMSGGVIYLSTAKTVLEQSDANKGAADYVLPKRASKEVKVSIGKLANAPKVKANYVAGTITIPKGADYWAYKNGASVPTTTSAVAATTLTLGTDIDASDNFAVDVQTAADPSKNKLASRLGHNVFAAQSATTVGDLTALTVDDKGKGTITNNSTKDSYVIYWWVDGKTDISTADLKKKNTKKTTVKPGKPASLAKVASAAGIAVQRVGVSKKGEEAWAGTIVQFKEGPNVEAYTAGESGGSGGNAEPTPAPTYSISVTDAADGLIEIVGATTGLSAGSKVIIAANTKANNTLAKFNTNFVVKSGSSVVPVSDADDYDGDALAYYEFTMPAGNVSIEEAD